jgi:hypothetical protein
LDETNNLYANAPIALADGEERYPDVAIAVLKLIV